MSGFSTTAKHKYKQKLKFIIGSKAVVVWSV